MPWRARVLFLFLGLTAILPETMRAEARDGRVSIAPGQKLIPIHGMWRFRVGDDMRFKDPGFADEDWVLIKTGVSWAPQGYRGTKNAWYRLRIRAADWPHRRLALALPPIEAAYQAYFNGVLIGSRGEIGPAGELLRKSMVSTLLTIPRSLLDKEGSGVLALRVVGYAGLGGATRRRFHLGRSDSVQDELFFYYVRLALYAASFLIIAFYHFVLFLGRRRETENLYFALACAGFGCYTLGYGKVLAFALDSYWGDKILSNICVTTSAYCLIRFGLTFFGFPYKWVSRTVGAFTIFFVSFMAAAVFNEWLYALRVKYVVPMQFASILFALLFFSFLVLKGIRRKKPGGRILGLGFLIMFVAASNDFLLFYGLLDGYYATMPAFLAVVLSMAIALAAKVSLLHREKEEARSAAMERMRELDGLKDEFLANTSHELRTPLNGIIGLAEGLLAGVGRDQPERVRHNLNLISRSGRRLAHLVNDILDFEKLRNHDLRLDPRPVSLAETVAAVLALTQPLAERKQIALESEIASDAPAVLADQGRLEQILNNLVGNAIKYTEAGSVHVSARAQGAAMIEVSVRDTGIGIPPESQAEIFESFAQVHGREVSGTGLGLSIARELVQLHGGTLNLESEPGRGSRFYFTLPAAPRGETLRPRESREVDSAGMALEPFAFHPDNDAEAPAPEDARLVLLVDDEPVNLEVMRNHLELAGYAASMAGNAEEARAKLKSAPPPDLVVLDIMMPGMSGLEFARELRGRYALTDLPILMVTARVRTEDLMAAMDAGANDYLTKPFQREEFLFRVSSLLSLARTRRETARKERERIITDLHDHLGGSLTDLKFLSDAARRNPNVDFDFAEKLQTMVGDTIALLRHDLLSLEDLSQLEENFLDGIQMILLRRYVDADRELRFQVPDERREQTHRLLRSEHIAVLYSVIKEMATNDLKYGSGESIWDFQPSAGDFKIVFRGLSNYRLERHGTGRGTAGMIRRLAAINGTLRMSLEAGAPAGIRVVISVPLEAGATPKIA